MFKKKLPSIEKQGSGAKFSRAYRPRMLVQFEGNFRFEGQAGALEDDFRISYVEYIVPRDKWDATGSKEPPQLMGMPLHLNTTLHVYVMHAWVWKNNPTGVWEEWNRTFRAHSLNSTRGSKATCQRGESAFYFELTWLCPSCKLSAWTSTSTCIVMKSVFRPIRW